MPAARWPGPVVNWVAQKDFGCLAASQAEQFGFVLIPEDASHRAEQDWSALAWVLASEPKQLCSE